MTISKDDFEWCIHGSVLVIEKSKLEDMAKEYLRSLRVHMFDKEQMDAEPSTKKRDMEFMNQSFEFAIEMFKQQNPYLQDEEKNS